MKAIGRQLIVIFVILAALFIYAAAVSVSGDNCHTAGMC